MRLDVACTPAWLTEREGRLCVVIDVLRLTSTLAVLFGRGLEEALVAATIDEARRLAGTPRDWLLCGEEGGLPPEGFAYGNSPAEFAALDLGGRSWRRRTGRRRWRGLRRPRRCSPAC